MRPWCRASVASFHVLHNFTKVAHVEPATARRAIYEVLLLVLGLAAERFANDDGLLHRRFRSNDGRALWASVAARSAASSGVALAMNKFRMALSRR